MPRHARNPKLEQFWRRHLQRQAMSRLTIRDYCREHDLSEPSFHGWRKTIADRDQQAAPPHPVSPLPLPAFLPVAIVDSPARHDAPPIDIRLANGCRIRVRSGCDRTLLADVVAILHASPRSEARPC